MVGVIMGGLYVIARVDGELVRTRAMGGVEAICYAAKVNRHLGRAGEVRIVEATRWATDAFPELPEVRKCTSC